MTEMTHNLKPPTDAQMKLARECAKAALMHNYQYTEASTRNMEANVSDELLKLAERVEALSGRSRVANARIWKACKPDEYHQWESSSRPLLPRGLSEDHKQGEIHERAKGAAPNFTGSLDAAMTLAPAKDRWPQIEYIGPNPNNPKQGHRVTLWPKNGQKTHGHSLVSFPLALTAAALRALAKEK